MTFSLLLVASGLNGLHKICSCFLCFFLCKEITFNFFKMCFKYRLFYLKISQEHNYDVLKKTKKDVLFYYSTNSIIKSVFFFWYSIQMPCIYYFTNVNSSRKISQLKQHTYSRNSKTKLLYKNFSSGEKHESFTCLSQYLLYSN